MFQICLSCLPPPNPLQIQLMLAEDQNPAAGLLRVIIYDVTGESSSCALACQCAAMHRCHYVRVMLCDGTPRALKKAFLHPSCAKQACSPQYPAYSNNTRFEISWIPDDDEDPNPYLVYLDSNGGEWVYSLTTTCTASVSLTTRDAGCASLTTGRLQLGSQYRCSPSCRIEKVGQSNPLVDVQGFFSAASCSPYAMIGALTRPLLPCRDQF